MNLLKNKSVLVTGSTQGIGWECAKLAARHGAHVMLCDIHGDNAQKCIKELRDFGGRAEFVQADVSKSDDVARMVTKTVEKFGGLDVAVNNAGIGGESKPVGELTLEDWNKVIGVNLTGVFLCAKEQIKQMTKQESGVIVNIASVLGRVGMAGSSAYVAAKHGVIGLTKNIALEYADQGLRSVAVGPGFIKTPLLDENLEDEEMKAITQMHPQGRMGRPEEVAELVVWLSSDRASFANGGYFPLDGGYLSQ